MNKIRHTNGVIHSNSAIFDLKRYFKEVKLFIVLLSLSRNWDNHFTFLTIAQNSDLHITFKEHTSSQTDPLSQHYGQVSVNRCLAYRQCRGFEIFIGEEGQLLIFINQWT